MINIQTDDWIACELTRGGKYPLELNCWHTTLEFYNPISEGYWVHHFYTDEQSQLLQDACYNFLHRNRLVFQSRTERAEWALSHHWPLAEQLLANDSPGRQFDSTKYETQPGAIDPLSALTASHGISDRSRLFLIDQLITYWDESAGKLTYPVIHDHLLANRIRDALSSSRTVARVNLNNTSTDFMFPDIIHISSSNKWSKADRLMASLSITRQWFLSSYGIPQ